MATTWEDPNKDDIAVHVLVSQDGEDNVIENLVINYTTGSVFKNTVFRGCILKQVPNPDGITKDPAVFENCSFEPADMTKPYPEGPEGETLKKLHQEDPSTRIEDSKNVFYKDCDFNRTIIGNQTENTFDGCKIVESEIDSMKDCQLKTTSLETTTVGEFKNNVSEDLSKFEDLQVKNEFSGNSFKNCGIQVLKLDTPELGFGNQAFETKIVGSDFPLKDSRLDTCQVERSLLYDLDGSNVSKSVIHNSEAQKGMVGKNSKIEFEDSYVSHCRLPKMVGAEFKNTELHENSFGDPVILDLKKSEQNGGFKAVFEAEKYAREAFYSKNNFDTESLSKSSEDHLDGVYSHFISSFTDQYEAIKKAPSASGDIFDVALGGISAVLAQVLLATAVSTVRLIESGAVGLEEVGRTHQRAGVSHVLETKAPAKKGPGVGGVDGPG
jgi:hypothetical protein